tara:strand:+ start:150 stop:971 length:822 start_codon:yes stop_codon:yes gene_type:complete
MHTKRFLWVALTITLATSTQAKDLRIGMVGLDTSHVTAFTRVLNDKTDKNHVPGAQMVAAVKDSSPDVESSYTRVEKYTTELTGKWGVKLYPTVNELCQHVDAVMIENVDGRPHLKHAIDVIKAGKPLYIDKPLAGTLEDCVKIYQLAKEHKVPVFSSSSLRFAKNTLAARAGDYGKVLRCETFSPAHLEPHHPDLFWYGIHGVESLFTVMGPGCVSVKRGTTDDGKIEVTGTWKNGLSAFSAKAKATAARPGAIPANTRSAVMTATRRSSRR